MNRAKKDLKKRSKKTYTLKKEWRSLNRQWSKSIPGKRKKKIMHIKMRIKSCKKNV